jgi:cytochrome b
MNTLSASPVEAGREARRRILVWDAPVRLFHWLMVLSFAGAWLTAESERLRLVHVTLGYTMAGLVAFRLVWGLVGSHHARFSSFVRGPRQVIAYLGAVLRGRPAHHAGHNPAGALAVLAILVLAVAVTASGWAMYQDLGGEWLEELHEAAASGMLAVVAVHVMAVVATSLLGRENLVGAMVTGRKSGLPEEGIRRAWRSVAVLMLAAVLGFWWLQWHAAPAEGAAQGKPPVSRAASLDEEHD